MSHVHDVSYMMYHVPPQTSVKRATRDYALQQSRSPSQTDLRHSVTVAPKPAKGLTRSARLLSSHLSPLQAAGTSSHTRHLFLFRFDLKRSLRRGESVFA